jgi:two-component system chemotaxis response regulator CheY
MKVLIVEDDPMSALVLQKTLESMGHESLVAADGLDAWELLEKHEIRLVISDWMMPRMDGLELCRRIRCRGRRVYTYVIVVTAKRQRKDRVEALQAGADDLLSKPYDQGELMARTRVAQRILTMQEELQARSLELEAMRDALEARNQWLSEMALCDSLTGLKNRRHFREVLDATFAFALRQQRMPLSMVMIDVDQFKAYNDTFGHPAGDAILSTLAEILLENTREPDLVARYGGEEFVILLPGTDGPGARFVCERIRTVIERHHWPLRPITASFGAASMEPGTLEAAQLINEADQALYQSKRRGRNRVTHFQELVATSLESPLGGLRPVPFLELS